MQLKATDLILQQSSKPFEAMPSVHLEAASTLVFATVLQCMDSTDILQHVTTWTTRSQLSEPRQHPQGHLLFETGGNT